MSEAKEAFNRLLKNRNRLTRQQLKTLAGQIKAGESAAAMKGLDRLLTKKREGGASATN